MKLLISLIMLCFCLWADPIQSTFTWDGNPTIQVTGNASGYYAAPTDTGFTFDANGYSVSPSLWFSVSVQRFFTVTQAASFLLNGALSSYAMAYNCYPGECSTTAQVTNIIDGSYQISGSSSSDCYPACFAYEPLSWNQGGALDLQPGTYAISESYTNQVYGTGDTSADISGTFVLTDPVATPEPSSRWVVAICLFIIAVVVYLLSLRPTKP